ncbi:MAG: glycosyltransferase family 4 protein [Patescibacteria group bacterium]|nr:glycosyltransferase family 4 protein [Patescibacteria group bacterium]
MKILLFSPYLNPPHFGGGEKYLFDVALTLVKEHQVYIGLSESGSLNLERIQDIKQQYQEFFDCDLSALKFISTPLKTKANFFKKLWWTKKFDAIFYASDGSFFFSLAKLNVAHIQFSLKIDQRGWLKQKKLKSWDYKISNSNFTKKIVEPSWPVRIDLVHQPMIRTEKFCIGVDLQKKEKIILNVGRFFSHLHSKRQDILVDIFKRLKKKYKKETAGWKLVLIGGVEDQEYANKVKKLAKGQDIEILHHVGRQELINWYKRSSIYWHATGYRINDEEEPEKVEHFGISTVEAMAAGNAPLVIGKGGQLEVVGEDLKKWTWLVKRDCIKKTAQVIRNQDLRLDLQKAAQKRAEKFGAKIFEAKLKAIFSQ